MTENKKTPETLRSARWFAPDDLRAFGHRSRAMQMGYAPEEWKDRPVIAILNTWSDAQPCHMHFKSRVDDVKRGILMAGGFPMELPALSLSRVVPEADHHALSQFAGDGCRGIAARPPGRRRGADGRLRQDHAGAVARRHQHEHPGDLSARGADAARQLERQDAGFGIGRLEILGRTACRQDFRQGLGRRRGRHRPQLRHLHDHGHRLDHDGDCRIHRHDAARRVFDSGGRRGPHPHGVGMRAAHCRDGLGRSDTAQDSNPQGVRKCDHGGDGDGLLHQRDHSSDRAGAPRRAGHRARRFRRQPAARCL